MKAHPYIQIENTLLGEGPVWDHRSGELWWVDIEQGILHCHTVENGLNRNYQFDQMIGAAIPCQDEGLILAMHHGLALFDPKTEKLTTISDPESHLPQNRFNDAKCDPYGRLWAGTMMIDKKRKPIGNLYCMDKDFKVTRKLENISISNGLAWNKAADTLYYIDTMRQSVQSFTYDNATGEIKKMTDALKFDSIYPDGMCIDENDNLWIAFYGSGAVVCYDPQTGKKLTQIEVPANQTTSCAFGGKDLDTLFITSSNRIEKTKHGGCVFAVKPGVKGSKASFFRTGNIDV